jgi:malate synthase
MNTVVLVNVPEDVEITGNIAEQYGEILTRDALIFVAELERSFRQNRSTILKRRAERQKELDSGKYPDFLAATEAVRQSEWKVGPIPADLQDRRVEITGPVERKMMINALNSGANIFMADFEDSNSPTWENVIQGQINLRDAIAGTISYSSPEGKNYKLNEKTATLLVRPRGWHLDEKHVLIDGKAVSASIFDFGLYFFHNAKNLAAKGSGPYFYLPKLESHHEARLWNDVFIAAQNTLGIPRGTIKVTVLIETILAAFEMDEILYELSDHAAGLNAGRWDYIFSIIKKFSNKPGFVFPDRSQLTMTTPFMRAYTELLVKTCHRRGAHAIGGMAAFIPSRKDQKVNETAMAKVREDKERESGDGFDGTWVAHPDLVPLAKEVFDGVLGDKPNQKERLREEVQVAAPALLDFNVPGGKITEEGIRNNISVALQYLAAWLNGNGAVAIYNLMEDAATAEISRSQLWQLATNSGFVSGDRKNGGIGLYKQLVSEECEKIKAQLGSDKFTHGKYVLAREILNKTVSSKEFCEFLTLIAYEFLE